MNTPRLTDAARTRRDFISQLALASAALPLAQLASSPVLAASTGSTGNAAPSAPTGPRTIHVFSKPLQMFSYDATAQLLAETGYTGIDYTVRRGGHVLPEKAAEDLP